MRFWDASAIVPLVSREAESARCRAWLRADRLVLVWALSAVEVASALARKRRVGRLPPQQMRRAKDRLARLERAWSEVTAWDLVRSRARRLLDVHPLRAADAMQLAAAIVAVDDRPAAMPFVTFDDRLREAARAEGFPVLPD